MIAHSMFGVRRIDPRRARHYRLLFLLAAVVYLGSAGWLAFFPTSFFTVLQLPQPSNVALGQAGLALAIIGFGLISAAVRLERAAVFVAFMLLGTVLAPSIWLAGVIASEWPVRTLVVVTFTCVIWWLPFALYLLEGTAVGARLRALAPNASAALNLLGAGALVLVLKPGTEAVAETASRISYISNHPFLWRGGWACWIAAALSLLALYAWWGTRIPRWQWGVAALAIASAGLAFDATGESLLIGWLPRDFATVAPMTSLLTGGAGNGLYTLAGVVLTIGTPSIRGWFAVWTWSIWAVGFGLSLVSFAGIFLGVAVCTGLLFALFCPWAVVMGRKLA